MFQLSILLLTVALAYASSSTNPRLYVKKQAIYPTSGPQNIIPAAQQNVPIADPNVQLQQAQVQDTFARSALPVQTYSAQSQQQPQQQQQQQIQLSPQQAVYAAGQQQPQQYPFGKQFQYYP